MHTISTTPVLGHRWPNSIGNFCRAIGDSSLSRKKRDLLTFKMFPFAGVLWLHAELGKQNATIILVFSICSLQEVMNVSWPDNLIFCLHDVKPKNKDKPLTTDSFLERRSQSITFVYIFTNTCKRKTVHHCRALCKFISPAVFLVMKLERVEFKNMNLANVYHLLRSFCRMVRCQWIRESTNGMLLSARW